MEPNSSIYQISDKTGSFGAWYVFGLNLLMANKVRGLDRLLPYREWLGSLIANTCPGALIGELAFRGQPWWAALGEDKISVATGVYAGDPYGPGDGTSNCGIYYPTINRRTLLTTVLDECFVDSNALMVLGDGSDRLRCVEILNSFTTRDDTLRRLCEVAQWIMISGHDAGHIEVWSQDTTFFTTILYCCEVVNRVVRDLPWWHENVTQLVWSEEELCYVVIRP